MALVFWLVPETASLSLEQIDDHFASGTKAWKTSLAQNKKLQREHELGMAGGVISEKGRQESDAAQAWEVEAARVV